MSHVAALNLSFLICAIEDKYCYLEGPAGCYDFTSIPNRSLRKEGFPAVGTTCSPWEDLPVTEIPTSRCSVDGESCKHQPHLRGIGNSLQRLVLSQHGKVWTQPGTGHSAS